jgi:hypothetical protein
MKIHSGTHSEVQQEECGDTKQLAQQEHGIRTLGSGVAFLTSS